MSNREIISTTRFSKDIKKLDITIQKKSYEIALTLSENPLNQELNIKQLKGFDKTYRVVILKNYRLVYKFDEETLFLLRIGHRRDIYRKL